MRALNKRLGKALGWSVDALLQSGDGEEIEKRKREALESLAYVRDVLNTAEVPKDLDEERLVGEQEMMRLRAERKEQEARLSAEREREEAALDAAQPSPVTTSSSSTFPPSVPSAVIPNTSRSRQYASSSSPAVGLPRTLHNKSASASPSSNFGLTQPLPTSFRPALGSTSAPSSKFNSSQPNRSPASTAPAPVAPWHSTPSSFSSFDAASALRRPPAAAASPGGEPIALDATLMNGTIRKRPSNVFSSALTNEAGTAGSDASAAPTYQSDPLRG